MDMNAIEYGIICQIDDEKRIVKNVDKFLDSLGYRKMYKWSPHGVRDPDHPEKEPRYDHYYCQFMKEQPRWYFDLYPNVDLDGRARFPEHPEMAWTLFVRKTFPEQNSRADDAKLDKFFSSLLAALGFPAKILHQYREDENRL